MPMRPPGRPSGYYLPGDRDRERDLATPVFCEKHAIWVEPNARGEYICPVDGQTLPPPS